jgi:translocation and assembly module TamB
MPVTFKHVFFKFFKVAAWMIACILLLLVAAILLIQLRAVQSKVTQKAVSFLEQKIGTDVSLDAIHISFPKEIVLEGIYFEDQQGDTLLYAGKLSFDTDLWALTRREIQLNDISLEHSVAFIDRAENDSSFNFSYILDAFAGDSTAVPDTLEQKEWTLSLQKISLDNIRLNYKDRLEGNIGSLSVGNFSVEMSEFDLEKNLYRVEEIVLTDTRANLEQTKLPEPLPAEASPPDSAEALLFSMEGLTLQNIRVRYLQSALGQSMKLNLGEAGLYAEHIDLQEREIALDKVTLRQTSATYVQHAAKTAVPETKTIQEKQDTPKQQWRISVKAIEFEDNNLAYRDFTKPESEQSFDPDHVSITDLTLDARDLLYSDSAIRAHVRDLSFRERSGFSLESLHGEMAITETAANITDLLLVTPNSRIQMRAKAAYQSLDKIASTYPEASLSADVNESFISFKDVLYFQPSLLDSMPLDLTQETKVYLHATVTGAVSDLRIDHLVFRALSETELRLSGSLTGLPHAQNLRMDIVLDKFYTTRADMNQILPDRILPDSVQLPMWLKLEAAFQGTMEQAAFNTALTSNVGDIHIEGSMNLDSTSATRGFDAELDIAALDIGDILGKPDSVLDKVAMEASLHASGLSLTEMNGTLDAVISRFDYLGYRYDDLDLKGTVRNDVVSVTATMADQNINFTLNGQYHLEEVPRYEVNFDVRNANFEALNMSKSPLRARGNLLVNIATSDFKVMNGNIGIRKVAIFNGDDRYAIDSLLFATIDQEGRSEINIESDLLTANFEGSINIFGLPQVLRSYFNTYYTLHDSLEVEETAPQHFSFNIDLKNTDILTDLLVPELTSFTPGEIRGEFDSEAQLLDVYMEIDEIQYANIGVRSLVFDTNSDSSELNYNLVADRIMVDSMRIDGLEFNGSVANDSLYAELVILDSADVNKYVLAGTFFRWDDGFQLRLSPENILLNYQQWSVPGNNYMRFGSGNFIARNVELVNGREKIIVESESGEPVQVGFRELNLEYLSSMIAEEQPLSGLLEGDIRFFPDTVGLAFTSDVTIEDLHVSKVLWGDVSLNVDQNRKNRFDVNFGLEGNGNNLKAEGFYKGGESPAIDLTADILSLNLASFQPLVENQLENLTGSVSGKIQVQGTPAKPDIDGSVTLQQTSFFSTYLNSAFTINQETISFVDEGILFDQFEVADNNQNTALLDGTILTQAYDNFEFYLNLTADDFRLLNTTEEDNDLFYGQVGIEATASIRGNMNTPVINMAIGLTEDSHLTYVVPQSEAAILESEGIVKFVDRTFEDDPFAAQMEQEASDTIKSTFRGIDLTAKIELTDEEALTIIIDPVTDDQLTVKGSSTLTLKIDPTGDIQLSGRYEITEGTYNLSFYKFVKREFAIESGSTITWSGDPLNARMDIRAIYTVETSPIELFSNQLSGADATEINRYKQRLPFWVYLDITGRLLQPEISFQLEMPMDERNAFGGNVYARLQDINTRESDLNKQVFALLILKRFIADNPFENQGATGFESTARRSVSKILSQQLNRLSENIKGVELSFDIKSYEDYSTGQAEGQTELQLGLSKSLFNDRLVVKLSGNIDIEGQNSNQDPTDYIGDLALEYKITPDGRFRITGFRNSNYDMIDGELVETGAGFIYVKDYNSLSELFKANAEQKN